MKHCAKLVLLNNNNALNTAISACMLTLVNLCLEMFLSIRMKKHNIILTVRSCQPTTNKTSTATYLETFLRKNVKSNKIHLYHIKLTLLLMVA